MGWKIRLPISSLALGWEDAATLCLKVSLPFDLSVGGFTSHTPSLDAIEYQYGITMDSAVTTSFHPNESVAYEIEDIPSAHQVLGKNWAARPS